MDIIGCKKTITTKLFRILINLYLKIPLVVESPQNLTKYKIRTAQTVRLLSQVCWNSIGFSVAVGYWLDIHFVFPRNNWNVDTTSIFGKVWRSSL